MSRRFVNLVKAVARSPVVVTTRSFNFAVKPVPIVSKFAVRGFATAEVSFKYNFFFLVYLICTINSYFFLPGVLRPKSCY